MPFCAEAWSNTADQLSGAGVTASSLYINRLAPRPWGTPYIGPLTEFHAWFFSDSKRSAQLVTGPVSTGSTSPPAIRRRVASPEAETASYSPPLARHPPGSGTAVTTTLSRWLRSSGRYSPPQVMSTSRGFPLRAKISSTGRAFLTTSSRPTTW